MARLWVADFGPVPNAGPVRTASSPGAERLRLLPDPQPAAELCDQAGHEVESTPSWPRGVQKPSSSLQADFAGDCSGAPHALRASLRRPATHRAATRTVLGVSLWASPAAGLLPTLRSEIIDLARIHVENHLAAPRIRIADGQRRRVLLIDLLAAEIANEDRFPRHLDPFLRPDFARMRLATQINHCARKWVSFSLWEA